MDSDLCQPFQSQRCTVVSSSAISMLGSKELKIHVFKLKKPPPQHFYVQYTALDVYKNYPRISKSHFLISYAYLIFLQPLFSAL